MNAKIMVTYNDIDFTFDVDYNNDSDGFSMGEVDLKTCSGTIDDVYQTAAIYHEEIEEMVKDQLKKILNID